ncbi:zinc finger protein 37 [Strongylocentrotus purpuratus]|uniref:C2H2-type domain-containing protein n=1 Tax=Strongylocentrotus purpuratus TaxID=7668 RepID=A0A7M7GMF3_STRPU|nr:zinc finger protein 37 [Strongylocentrotus purpuratus]
MEHLTGCGNTGTSEGAGQTKFIQERGISVEDDSILNPFRPKEVSIERDQSTNDSPRIPVSNNSRGESTPSAAGNTCTTNVARIAPLKTLANRVYVHSIQKSVCQRTKSYNATYKRQRSVNNEEGICQGDAPERGNDDGRGSVPKTIAKTPVYPIYAQSLHQSPGKKDASSRRSPHKNESWKASNIDNDLSGTAHGSDHRRNQISTMGEVEATLGEREGATMVSKSLGHPPSVQHLATSGEREGATMVSQSLGHPLSVQPLATSGEREGATMVSQSLVGHPPSLQHLATSGEREGATMVSQSLVGHPPSVQHLVNGTVSDISSFAREIENNLRERNSWLGVYPIPMYSSLDSQTRPNMLQYPMNFQSMHQNNLRVDSENDGSSCTSRTQTVSRDDNELNDAEKLAIEKAQNVVKSLSLKTSWKPKEQFKCESCDKIFKYQSQLKLHELKHTGDRPFQCDVCTDSFRSRNQLTNHHRKHSGEKPYVCKVCNMAFRRSNQLNVHVRQHSGKRTFQCQYCEEAFAEKGSLCSHMRTHAGIKPHKCEVCGKAFKRRSQMTPHMRVHTGDQPFLCSLCNQAFSQKVHLQSHMRKHSGEKPYECEVCHKTYRDHSQLKSHFRVHTGEKNYKCKLCPLAFRYLPQLKKHLKSLHADEAPVTSS